MELFFLPNSRQRFFRRNFPSDNLIRWGYPNNFFDEDFAVVDCPLPPTRRNISFIVPKGRYFQRRKEDTKDETKSKEGETKNEEETKSDERKEKSLQINQDNFFRNLIKLEEVFPSFDHISSLLQTSDKVPFEVNVNLHGCDPEKTKVEIKDGILKVEGRKETSDGSYIFVRHEQTIPNKIDPSKIKASLLPEGILKIRQSEETQNIPITMENEVKSHQLTNEKTDSKS
ncbi:UNVERIFIED_CONTAM: hypothetical protein RMT77_014653 [Armadillidium vulgare]